MNHSQINNTYLSPTGQGGLYWGPLVEGVLIKRYKRFLADVEVDGKIITAHTANTGRMLGCSEPGRKVWLSSHEGPNSKRKYSKTLEMISMPTALVGINTMVPNHLVAQAATHGKISQLSTPLTTEREITFGQSRLDLRFTENNGRVTVVEVKNCTLAEGGTAFFPDAVTTRGFKHLEELAILAEGGLRAAVFILVQRADAQRFSPADHIDPAWGGKLREVLKRGVEIWVYQAVLDFEKITLGPSLPVVLP